MPPVTLTKVTVSAAIGLVDGRSLLQRERSIQLDVRHMPQYTEQEQPTYQIHATVRGNPVGTQASVWTIANLLRGDIFDADDVLEAVETALDILQSTDEPIIRFHKQTGLLIARGDPAFEPILCGGPQERGRRGGTENVAAIVGLGVACELAEEELPDRMRDYAGLRDRLWEGIHA